MYQLHLGIGPGLEKQLRAWAEARDLSIAAAVRLILRERLPARTTTSPRRSSDDRPT